MDWSSKAGTSTFSRCSLLYLEKQEHQSPPHCFELFPVDELFSLYSRVRVGQGYLAPQNCWLISGDELHVFLICSNSSDLFTLGQRINDSVSVLLRNLKFHCHYYISIPYALYHLKKTTQSPTACFSFNFAMVGCLPTLMYVLHEGAVQCNELAALHLLKSHNRP